MKQREIFEREFCFQQDAVRGLSFVHSLLAHVLSVAPDFCANAGPATVIRMPSARTPASIDFNAVLSTAGRVENIDGTSWSAGSAPHPAAVARQNGPGGRIRQQRGNGQIRPLRPETVEGVSAQSCEVRHTGLPPSIGLDCAPCRWIQGPPACGIALEISLANWRAPLKV